jgi:hypothetical protein
MKKERKFSTNFELMTTFPNASNPKKKNDQIFLQTMQEDMNFKPETEI